MSVLKSGDIVKEHKNVLLPIISILILLSGIGYLVYREDIDLNFWEEDITPPSYNENSVGLPDPSGGYCVEQGYECEYRGAGDSITSYCIFPDGTECVEWNYYCKCTENKSYCSPDYIEKSKEDCSYPCL